MHEWLCEVEEISPWTEYGEEDNPHSVTRHGYEALILYLDSFINNEMCQGYSKYHWSSVKQTDVQVCTDPEIASKFNIDVGDSYYVFDEQLTLSLTGDGAANVKNTPSDVKNVALSFLKVFAFENDLLQCRHAGILVLLSCLGDKDRRIVDWMQQISADLGVYGFVSVWCDELECWFCFEYKKFNNGDWAWQHKMSHCCVSSNGDWGLINRAVWDPEIENWRGLHKTEFYECLISENIQPYEETKLQQAIVNATVNENLVHSMTTNDIARDWAYQLEDDISQQKERAVQRGTIERWTEKYEHTQRLTTSKKQQHGILYIGDPDCFDFECGLFDPCHCMWAIILTFVHVLIMLMWVVWKWDKQEIKHVIGQIGSGTITDQTSEYLDENGSRNVKKWPKLHATGLTLKIMLNGFVYCLVDAANIAWTYENRRQDGNFTATLLIAVIFKVYWLMREAFGILFTFQFDIPDDATRPPLIDTLIHNVQLATFIAYQLCYVLVS